MSKKRKSLKGALKNKRFERICRLSQSDLKTFVTTELVEFYGAENVTCADGFVYAKGTFPVCLVAHMDTVHKNQVETIVFDPAEHKYSSPQGIGGDDRCGIYMILEIIKSHPCSVIFTEDEEVGGVGAGKFTDHPVHETVECNYLIEFDRKGSNDAVFYYCDNEDFMEFVTAEFYKENYGTYSDICDIAPAIGVSAVNLSCGYYKAHTTDEYVLVKEMEASIAAAKEMLDRTNLTQKFEWKESDYYYDDYYYGGGWFSNGKSLFGGSSSNKEVYYLISYLDIESNAEQWFDCYAYNEEEALGKCMKANPMVCYADIMDIYEDKER